MAKKIDKPKSSAKLIGDIGDQLKEGLTTTLGDFGIEGENAQKVEKKLTEIIGEAGTNATLDAINSDGSVPVDEAIGDFGNNNTQSQTDNEPSFARREPTPISENGLDKKFEDLEELANQRKNPPTGQNTPTRTIPPGPMTGDNEESDETEPNNDQPSKQTPPDEQPSKKPTETPSIENEPGDQSEQSGLNKRFEDLQRQQTPAGSNQSPDKTSGLQSTVGNVDDPNEDNDRSKAMQLFNRLRFRQEIKNIDAQINLIQKTLKQTLLDLKKIDKIISPLEAKRKKASLTKKTLSTVIVFLVILCAISAITIILFILGVSAILLGATIWIYRIRKMAKKIEHDAEEKEKKPKAQQKKLLADKKHWEDEIKSLSVQRRQYLNYRGNK